MERPADQLQEWEWIERYWSGQLPPAEKAFFEQVMTEDKRFAGEVATLRQEVGVLETARMERHVRQSLRRLHETDRRAQLIRVRWLGAGAGLVAACVGVLLLLSFRPLSLPGYERDLDVIRDLNGTYRTDSTDHLSQQRKQTFDLFFEAQALLSEGQPKPAAQRFEQVLTFSNLRPYFREAVQWHLVVCYLKTGQSARAQAVYEQVSNNHAYDISSIDRWQIGWQVWLANRLGA